MNKQRFKERFSTSPEGVIVKPLNGEPRRADGRPLSAQDKLLLQTGNRPVNRN